MKAKIIIVLAVWLVSSILLGYAGVFQLLPGPVAGGAVAVFIAALLVLYFGNSGFRVSMDSMTLPQLTVFHVIRVGAGVLFFYYMARLPHAFAVTAAWGDLIAGVLAFGVILPARTKFYYYVFNLWGFADLINGLSLGMYFLIVGDVKIGFLLGLPLLPIPAFAVPVLLFSHFVSLRKLGRMK